LDTYNEQADSFIAAGSVTAEHGYDEEERANHNQWDGNAIDDWQKLLVHASEVDLKYTMRNLQ
jgi:hypothetical protein